MNRHLTLLSAAAGLLSLAACKPIDSGAALQSPDPNVRMNALVQAGSSGDESAVPDIVPALQSEDPLVRWAAQQSLQKLTGTTLGYNWCESPDNRQKAIQKWVQWCKNKNFAVPNAS